MRGLVLVVLLSAAARAATIETRAVDAVAVRPVLVQQLGALIGARVDFGFQISNPPEIELANLEALMIRRDGTPGGAARAEAARLLAGYLAHPDELARQRTALAHELGNVRVDFLARQAAALREKARERPTLAERLKELEARVAPPTRGVDGAAERLNAVFDGWTERWDDSALSAVPGAFAVQRYFLIKPDGGVHERRSIRVPKGDARRPHDPFMAGVAELSRRVERAAASARAADEPDDERSDWRLMGGTLAGGAALLGLAGVLLGVPLSWKLALFSVGAAGAVLGGRGLARRPALRVSLLSEGVEPRTYKILSSPEAEEALWKQRERLEARAGIAVMAGALAAFLSLGWLLLAPALAGAWLSALAGLPVAVHPPLWSYLAALAGAGAGFGLIGWSWGVRRATALAEAVAELVALDGTRRP